MVTTQGRDVPSRDNESALTGSDYRCSSKTFSPIIAVNESNWLLAGTGATNGMKLPAVAGQEFNGVTPQQPVPGAVEILFHSPIACGDRKTYQDTTYYTAGSYAGVFYAGAYFWTCAIGRSCDPYIEPRTSEVVTRITTNLLRAAATGPLGKTHPSVGNVGAFYPAQRGKR